MRRYFLQRFHVDLNMNEMTDEKRDTLIAAIVKVAPTSTLIKASPAMQASVAALTTKGETFKADRAKVAADRQTLAADIDTENEARAAVDLELLTLAGLVATNAKSSADITGAGFNERPPAAPKPPFAPPDSLDIKFPAKERGKFKVSPHGNLGSHWEVQVSPDPIGPATWTEVPGSGKSRTITGPSGSKVWVRYAMVRGTTVSAWSTPVLVTIP